MFHKMRTLCFFLIFLGLFDTIVMQDRCKELLNEFATIIANFTSCAIIHSRPITLCENCIEAYIDIQNNYKELKDHKENSVACIDYFINLDRLQIVQTQLENSYNLWDTAKCSDCYETINGTLSTNKSTEMIQFSNYHKIFDDCVNRNNKKNETLCQNCKKDYLTLDNYYRSITDENLRIGICMDIVDIMNTTRSFWSPKCCIYRKRSEYVFIGSTILILFSTVAFYILVHVCAERKVPTILQQSRFAAFLQTNDVINPD